MSWLQTAAANTSTTKHTDRAHHSFFFCIPQLYLWVSSAFPALSLGFTILLLLRSQLYLWASPFFFFFCVPSSVSGLHHSSSSVFPALSLGFTILLLLLRSQLYLWDSLSFFFCVPQLYLWDSLSFFFFYVPQLYLWDSPFFFCVPSSISGLHHSSSSVFPALSLGFTILLLLCSQLYLWASPFLVRFLCM